LCRGNRLSPALLEHNLCFAKVADMCGDRLILAEVTFSPARDLKSAGVRNGI
jgi:hypothetical protein